MRKGFAQLLLLIPFFLLLTATAVFYYKQDKLTKTQTPNIVLQSPNVSTALSLSNSPAFASDPSSSQSTYINISDPIEINKITWRKIESERVSLSFNYPSVWPIAFESDEDLKRDQDFYNRTLSVVPDQPYPLESIAFTNEWIGNAGEDSLGWFIVTRQKGIETIDDYVKSVDNESEIYIKGRNVTIPRPKIVYSKVGGETAISVIDQSGLANLSPTDSANDFIVIKNGLIYRLFATPSFKARINAEINAKLFKEIIASIQF